MADVIVKQFVIDTSQSVQNLKAVETQVNATTAAVNTGATAINNVAKAEDNVGASSQSLKAQLRSLQAELAKTEPDSAKYRELSSAAGELKDKIQDAAQAVGTQAGGAFEKVGGSLGLVTSRIANLDFQGAAEGAKLLAKNITEIKPGDIANGVKGIGSALGSVGKALLTNPIFLIGAAIAAAIVYSKELLSLVDGVTDAETAALDKQKERAALAKEQVDIIGQQEESLKRQGYSEKQILDLKLQALDTAILEQQVVVETTKTQAAGQIAAAERNYKYLKGFLDFVTLPQRKLTEFFFNFYNGAVDLINKLGFSFEKVDVTAITKGFDAVNDTIAKALFDPEQTKKEGEKVIKESEATLRQLTNQRDGLINAQAAKEKAASDKAISDAQKAADDAVKIEQEKQKRILDAQRAAAEESRKITEKIQKDSAKPIESAKSTITNADDELKKQRDAEELRISLMAEGTDKEIALADLKYAKLRDAAQGDADLKKQIAKENADAVNKIVADAEEKNRQEQLATIMKGLEWAQKGADALQGISDLVFANRMSKAKKGSAEDEKLAKQQFKVNKALQLAGATIDASKAITSSLAAAPVAILGVPNPAGIASLALAITQGATQIAKISATQFQSSTPPASTTPSIPENNTTAQPAQFNPLAAQFVQNRPDQVTPRAFVLAGDVASQQEVRQKVEDLARIG
jgi:hypothetical protein